MQIFFDDLALPRPDAHPARRDARVEEPARRLRQRRHAEQPARGALDARRDRPAHRARRGVARRTARARGASSRRCSKRRGPPTTIAASIEALEAADRRAARARCGASRSSTRSTCATATACACRCRPRKAVMFCLMDVSGSMDESAQGPGQALLHPALPVPDAALREDRRRLHPPPHAGAGSRRRELLPRRAKPAARSSRARWC